MVYHMVYKEVCVYTVKENYNYSEQGGLNGTVLQLRITYPPAGHQLLCI